MRRTLVAACLLGLLPAPVFAAVIDTISDDFTNASGVTLFGNANINAGTLQLTPNVGSQYGSAVVSAAPPTAGTYDRIAVNFAFTLDPAGSLGEADGASFVLAKNSTPSPLNASGQLPNGSFTPGNVETGNVAGSFAVTFDIHPDPAGAGSNPGIGLNFNAGAQTTALVNPTFDFSDNRYHQANLEIQFLEGGGADVSLSVIEDIFGTPGAPQLLFDEVNFPNLNPFDFRFAFAARTGGEAADQRVDNFNAQFFAIPEPASVFAWLLIGSIGCVGGVLLRRKRPSKS